MTNANTAFPTGHVHADGAGGQAQFASDFESRTSEVARPMFERFARLAMRRGFAAIVKRDVDRDNNPSLALCFLPDRGGRLGAGPSTQCVFSLKALLAERAVVHMAGHDPRDGANGYWITRSDLGSINASFLEMSLEEFLRRALESRPAARADAE